MFRRFWSSGLASIQVAVFRVLYSACTVVAVLGCGGTTAPDWPDVVPVTGEVTQDGKPLSSARVMFIPSGDTVGPGGSALTDESGKFTATSMSADGKQIDGLIPGKYKVAISRFVKPDGSVWTPEPGSKAGPMTMAARESIPQQFSNPVASKLTANVDQGGGTFTFPITSK